MQVDPRDAWLRKAGTTLLLIPRGQKTGIPALAKWQDPNPEEAIAAFRAAGVELSNSIW